MSHLLETKTPVREGAALEQPPRLPQRRELLGPPPRRPEA